MPEANELAPAATSGVSPELIERRRPGRPENVSPHLHLLPLLRDAASVEIALEHDALPDAIPEAPGQPQDGMGAARGLILALFLVTPFWCVVGLVAWWLAK